MQREFISGRNLNNLSSDQRAEQIALREARARGANLQPENINILSPIKNSFHYAATSISDTVKGGRDAITGTRDTVIGLVNTGKGLFNTGKGVVETAVGLAKDIDSVAVGLGAIAIMTIGAIISPIPAMLSRDRNIIDVNRENINSALTLRNDRLVGWSLIALTGTYALWKAGKI